MSLPKPVVRYKSNPDDTIVVGLSAYIYPINHPSARVSNTQLAQTSCVLSIEDNGIDFETKNTIYKGVK